MTELKPCAFCGGKAIICKYKEDDNSTMYQPICEGANCVVFGMFNDEEEAIKAWNTRPTCASCVNADVPFGKVVCWKVDIPDEDFYCSKWEGK